MRSTIGPVSLFTAVALVACAGGHTPDATGGMGGAAGTSGAGGPADSGASGGSSGSGGIGGIGAAAGGGGSSGAAGPDAGTTALTVTFPRRSITPDEVALVVNTMDPQSVAVAAYYQEKRHIPDANVIRVAFNAKGLNPNARGDNLSTSTFLTIKKQIDAVASSKIQALAVSWTLPYRVDCMSITSALTFGFNSKYCGHTQSTAEPDGCALTPDDPYFASSTTKPHDDLNLRPAMLLAGTSVENVKKLIDHGVASDGTFPTGTGYLVRTYDGARSEPRWMTFLTTSMVWGAPGLLKMKYLDGQKDCVPEKNLADCRFNMCQLGAEVTDKTDILFYFTGVQRLFFLDANAKDRPGSVTDAFVPGGVGDHLTSFGGVLEPDVCTDQMSILRFLEHGAVASYGTINEPCAHHEKFPDTLELVTDYVGGATVIEAYWKSVAEPGQGVFVGEPLAAPWKPTWSLANGTLTLRITFGKAQTWTVEGADAAAGPWTEAKSGASTGKEIAMITIPNATKKFYRLVEK